MCETELKLNPQRPQTFVWDVFWGQLCISDSLRAPVATLAVRKSTFRAPHLSTICPYHWCKYVPPCLAVLSENSDLNPWGAPWQIEEELPKWLVKDTPHHPHLPGARASCLWALAAFFASVYLIKVQPLQLVWNSRHVFILISACCQQVFP